MQDEYYGYVKELLLGFREIKMSTARNDTLYHQYIKDNRLKSKILGTKTAIKNIDNELMGSYSWYVVVGVILFALPRFYNVSVVDVASFVITVLFLMNPISILLNNIPFFNRLKIALERINALEEEFNTGALVLTPESRIDASLYQGRYAGTVEKVETISFRDVTYEHLDKEKKSKFVLGPVNLTINRGELVFITGGNGSGKSTFAHLLVGLYRPLEGGVYLNGELVTDADCQGYTSQVSVIFSNNYLFARNYDDFDLVSTNPEYLRYIRMMRLGEVIKFDDKRKWVDVNLSRGQQKRLALILALMENREVLVLDEWAAEQDPEFRQYFYKNLLPMLRDMGKTVIVITHDDKYFHCGDRTIRFDSGRIVSDVGVVPQEQTVN
jgi:cyclic peptide transporter